MDRLKEAVARLDSVKRMLERVTGPTASVRIYEHEARLILDSLPEWRGIESAPLKEMGHVWSPDYPDRNDMVGTVVAYPDGERFVSGPNLGVRFTLWCAFPPLPPPPVQETGG